MKNRYLLIAAAAVLCLIGCGKEEESKSNLPALQVAFSSDNFTCEPGETLPLPYTITNIQGAQLSLSAKSSSSDCKVSVSADENFQGSVLFIAPAYSDGQPVTVTLNVSDPANSRTSSATATVTVAESDPLEVSLVAGLKSIAVKPSGSVEIPFTVSGAASTVTVAECKADGSWKAEATVASDNQSGTLKLTAPGTLTSSVSASVTVKDENGRTASLECTLSVVEISSSQTAANCYIVAPGSTVTINAVKGNSTEKLDFDNACLVWQDAVGMVKAASGNGSEGVVVVTLNPGVSGNAVVAAKKGDTIVWSWHLWVTDFNPDDDPFVWTSSAGTTYTYMDRNLGASTNAKYDAGAFGLMYQWGRKDPFESGNGIQSNVMKKQYDIDGNQIYFEAKDHPRYNDHKTTTLEASIANPMVFYTAPNDDYPCQDWLTNDGELQDNDLWGGVTNVKTKYDPCPAGWMVPAAGDGWGFRNEYKKAGKINDNGLYDSSYAWYIEPEDGKDSGFRYKFADTGKEYWFPLCGNIKPHNGTLDGTGGSGQLHTRSASGTLAAVQAFAWGNPASEFSLNRPYGSAVRCIKE